MRLISLLVAAMACAVTLPASSAEKPEQVVRAYYVDLNQRDWLHAASLFDPEALDTLKASFEPLFSAPDGQPLLRRMYGDSATPTDAAKSTSQDFYARFMQFLMPQQGPTISVSNVEIVGSVKETSELTHVIVRSKTTVNNVSVDDLEVVSLKRKNGEWRITLKGEILGLAEALKARGKKSGG